jgi:alpha-L-rhamnosidase
MDERRNTMQTAYWVRCAPTPEDLGGGQNLVWDSGKVLSDQSVHVEYAGKELVSCQRVYWQVKVWGNHGNEWHGANGFWEMDCSMPVMAGAMDCLGGL